MKEQYQGGHPQSRSGGIPDTSIDKKGGPEQNHIYPLEIYTQEIRLYFSREKVNLFH